MDAIYARQSVDKKDSLSVEGQVTLCRKLAGEEVLVFEDRGFSGKNTRRPAFLRLMDAVKAGSVQRIFVYRLDRFSRSVADFSRLWELLEEHGVSFHSVTESFDTSGPMGRAMLNIILVFAQLERETTSQRVKDNYLHRFSLGAWTGGPAPFGYSLVRRLENGRTVSSLAEDENGAWVRRIFFEYAEEGVSLRGLARSLTERGVHGPKRTEWDSVTLSRLLRSPIYVRADEEVYFHYLGQGVEVETGLSAFDGVHGCLLVGRRSKNPSPAVQRERPLLTVAGHEGMVSSETWLRVQEKLSSNGPLAKGQIGKHSWLTGRLKCAKCGKAVKINSGRRPGQYYLLCSGRSNSGACSASIRVDLKELERHVEKELEDLLRFSPETGKLPPEDAARLLEIEGKIRRLVGALAEVGGAASGYISRRVQELDEERTRLLSSPLREKAPRIDFSSADMEEKKQIAGLFVEKIILEEDKAMVYWAL